MLRWMLFQTEVLLDFTAPAWFALLSLMLPAPILMQTAAACLLHESAHFLTIALLHQHPQSLRISAAGISLRIRGDALCPLPVLCAVLLAGPAANLTAAFCFFLAGLPDIFRANLSLGLLSLLPYSGTDCGTLLEALLSHHLLTKAPEHTARILRITALCTSALLTILLLSAGVRNPSLWGMLFFLTGADCGAFTRYRSEHRAEPSSR